MIDHELSEIISLEEKRQQETINLIASENCISHEVQEILGSAFSNKYAEGYPGGRYYAGNIHTDALELLCIKRAKELFNLESDEWNVNVQALSGSPANLAVYAALISQEGSIMGLSLSHGGHLTHGHSVSMTGKWWRSISYEVAKGTELLDYDLMQSLALKEKPSIIVVGYTAYSRTIDWKRCRDIADACGAYLHVDMSHIAGLVAGGAYPSPFPYADTVMTTTHKTLRGPRGALIFSRKDSRELGAKIDKAVFPGLQGGPHMHTIAAITQALSEANTDSFKQYAAQVISNASILAETLQSHGWRVVSGGTDTHLFLLDTGEKGINGTQASITLEQAGIIVNKNTIPFDTRSPRNPSGIRIGTAFETTRGKTEADMKDIGNKIHTVLQTLL